MPSSIALHLLNRPESSWKVKWSMADKYVWTCRLRERNDRRVTTSVVVTEVVSAVDVVATEVASVVDVAVIVVVSEADVVDLEEMTVVVVSAVDVVVSAERTDVVASEEAEPLSINNTNQ